MTVSGGERLLWWIGLALLAAVLIYPPWIYTNSDGHAVREREWFWSVVEPGEPWTINFGMLAFEVTILVLFFGGVINTLKKRRSS